MGYEKSFIEVQFPVSKISKESYKERKANLSQTLTGLGKWWGRKPLILIRAVLLGALMPATDNPKKDREIFLKLLTMDDEGLLIRKFKNLTVKDIYINLNDTEKLKYFTSDSTKNKPNFLETINQEQRVILQQKAFNNLSYDEKLKYCNRPEHIKNISTKEWNKINEHLGTNANSLQELVKELGIKKYGNIPRVGDCFAGGGSIPFESARIGASIYGSDVNPIAALLTWSDLNIIGSDEHNLNNLRKFQKKIYDLIDNQIIKWKIETNERGDRADSYLYCNEVICPECGYKVPLSPTWIIGQGTKTVAILKDNKKDGFDIDIIENANKLQLDEAKCKATIRKNNIYCPHCNNETPMLALRRDHKDSNNNIIWGLRRWSKDEFMPNKEDVFQDRLYCIRYIHKEVNKDGKEKIKRYYIAPSKQDLKREEIVENILKEKFNEWQEKGYIPNRKIEKGYNTDQPIRERGWQYWHQLFNKRQLLLNGLILKSVLEEARSKEEIVIGLLGVNKCIDYNSKLSHWNSSSGNEKVEHTFYNQALNTLSVYGSRGLSALETTWFFNINNYPIKNRGFVNAIDARKINVKNDIWITDPPYADAVNYHELSEFFLAWDSELLLKAFPEWYTDSKRILAVKGIGESFNQSMIEVYKNLTNNMSDNGLQIVMFTHQDVKVWAELAMILWECGLQVTAAWNIATETEASGLKDGNYVKGTVILVLRKQASNDSVYLDELYQEIEDEVKNQINSMRMLDDKDEPNFNDPDYILAAYAASLKVLTSYKSIEDIDVELELSQGRSIKGETPIQKIINEAKKIAYDYLIPVDFDKYLWKELKPVERFYLKGLEFEMNNMCKLSGYQELAKGFGVNEYNWMLGSTKANSARVKTPKEFAMRNINDNSVFGQSLLRHVLASIYIALKEEDANKGLNWLKTEVNDYWNNRNMLVEILNYLSKVEVIDSMEHWKECAHEAFILKNLLENDSI